ncbi:hypothetical protein ABZ615_10420 [Streptomyces sp. NPDC007325]|uniref:hypothetical protein n=1 Tax=Streptomyces sp. NPDC007325 TaxID=3154588 RepID=UPI0033D52ECC
MSEGWKETDSVAERDASRRAVDHCTQIADLAFPAGGGRQAVNARKLRELVSADPELSVTTCRAYVGMAVNRISAWRGYAQFAIAISWAYSAEFGDDNLTVWVRDELKANGVDVPDPVVTAPVHAREVPTAGRADPEFLSVAPVVLDSCDIYAFVVRYAHHAVASGRPEEIARLKRMRGSQVILFEIPLDDRREVWEVPQVRAYVTKLADRLPYLPYYFHPDPKYAMAPLWFSCLAPPSAWSGKHLDLMDDAVLGRMAHAMYSLDGFAQSLGDDPEEVRRSVFASLPADVTALAASVARRIAELDDEGAPGDHA